MGLQPASVTIRYPDEREGPFSLRLWVSDPTGRPAVVGIEMWGIKPRSVPWGDSWDDNTRQGWRDLPDLPDTPILAENVRLKLGQLLRDKYLSPQRNLADGSVGLWGEDPDQRASVQAFLADLDVEVPHGGKKRLTKEFLEAVATVYLTARDAGRHPSLAVKEWAEADGIPVPADTARTWVRRAAERGLLPKGTAGKVRTEEES